MFYFFLPNPIQTENLFFYPSLYHLFAAKEDLVHDDIPELSINA